MPFLASVKASGARENAFTSFVYLLLIFGPAWHAGPCSFDAKTEQNIYKMRLDHFVMTDSKKMLN